ncbi:MAG TPA: hypothetical protein VFR07_17470 [Mycobacteriales bacterium]|jgi:hypothetical protein|nr:hypothetical protein [Mycobacteriales bacterium]
MTTRRKKITLIATSSVAAVALSGVAFAYWTSTGNGTDNATTGTAEVVTINQLSNPTAMGPGVAPQSLDGDFTTANPAFVGQVTATVTGTNQVGCGPTDYTIVQPTVTNAEVVTGTTWGGGSIAFNNKLTNQNACQGALVTIGYTSN